MKTYIFLCLLIFSTNSYAAEYNLELTFVDGYTNKPIINEIVTLRIVNLDWSQKLTTDSGGTVKVNFEAEHFIKYNFRFESGNYEFQTRERYLGEDKNIRLVFALYPSRKYEKSITLKESAFLEGLSEAPDSSTCFPTVNDVAGFLTEVFIDEHLQLPFWYGDYGFKVEFLVKAVFAPNGKPCQIEIIESSDRHLNKEIIRLVRLIPEIKRPMCTEQYMRTLNIPITIDHDNIMWDE